MADAGDSKSPARKGVWVQVPPPAPTHSDRFRRWALAQAWPALARSRARVDALRAGGARLRMWGVVSMLRATNEALG